VGGQGAPVGEEDENRQGGGVPAGEDRVRKTGNDEEAVRGTRARLARA
jgi:hypothetical protein